MSGPNPGRRKTSLRRKIGFTGLGIVCKPMSKNLIGAGRELAVYDVVEAPFRELEKSVPNPYLAPSHRALLRFREALETPSMAPASTRLHQRQPSPGILLPHFFSPKPHGRRRLRRIDNLLQSPKSCLKGLGRATLKGWLWRLWAKRCGPSRDPGRR